jgi:lipid-A-disaccharide synthase
MTDSGVQLLTHTNRLGSVGLTEPLATIPGLVRAFVKIRRHILDATPDAAVLIGHDLFNTILARWLQRRRIRCVCFFPPQVWLWRSLAGPIARPYRCMLTVFPEEQQVYEKVGGRAIFVGHYLRDEILPITSEARAAARDRCGFAADDRVVALLPGSRPQEVRQLALPFTHDFRLDK